VTQWEPTCASTAASSRDAKIRLILEPIYYRISDIKLKRTDTTLDLSQKAVEGKLLAGYSSEVGGEGDVPKRAKEKSRWWEGTVGFYRDWNGASVGFSPLLGLRAKGCVHDLECARAFVLAL